MNKTKLTNLIAVSGLTLTLGSLSGVVSATSTPWGEDINDKINYYRQTGKIMPEQSEAYLICTQFEQNNPNTINKLTLSAANLEYNIEKKRAYRVEKFDADDIFGADTEIAKECIPVIIHRLTEGNWDVDVSSKYGHNIYTLKYNGKQ